MTTLPSKVKDRLVAGIKKFKRILEEARARELNEAETSRRVQEMLVDVFGFDRLNEITAELEAHGQSCDLAVILEGNYSNPKLLIEVKAVTLKLRDDHVKQAVNYGSSKGTKWAVLTNGVEWRIYKVGFPKQGRPLDEDLVATFDFLTLEPKNEDQLGLLYLLTKEALIHSALEDYDERQEAMSRFFIGAVIMSDPVLDVIRRELRRTVPGLKVTTDEIQDTLKDSVLKNDVCTDPKFDDARRLIRKAQGLHQKEQTSQPSIATAKVAEDIVPPPPSATDVLPPLPSSPPPSPTAGT